MKNKLYYVGYCITNYNQNVYLNYDHLPNRFSTLVFIEKYFFSILQTYCICIMLNSITGKSLLLACNGRYYDPSYHPRIKMILAVCFTPESIITETSPIFSVKFYICIYVRSLYDPFSVMSIYQLFSSIKITNVCSS